MRIFNALKRGIERTETREHLTKTHKNVVQPPVIAIFQPTKMRAQMRDNSMTGHNNHVSADLLGPQVFHFNASNSGMPNFKPGFQSCSRAGKPEHSTSG